MLIDNKEFLYTAGSVAIAAYLNAQWWNAVPAAEQRMLVGYFNEFRQQGHDDESAAHLALAKFNQQATARYIYYHYKSPNMQWSRVFGWIFTVFAFAIAVTGFTPEYVPWTIFVIFLGFTIKSGYLDAVIKARQQVAAERAQAQYSADVQAFNSAAG